MTDTLADSRTSARKFADGVPLVVEDVTARPASGAQEILANPGFGRYFTDRMFVARYRAGEGWYDARLTAYGPLQLDPAMAALHYAQSISRASRRTRSPTAASPRSGPGQRRAVPRSAKRLAMPPVPEEPFLAAVDALVDADRAGCRPGPTRRCTCGRTRSRPSRSSACGRPTSTCSS